MYQLGYGYSRAPAFVLVVLMVLGILLLNLFYGNGENSTPLPAQQTVVSPISKTPEGIPNTGKNEMPFVSETAEKERFNATATVEVHHLNVQATSIAQGQEMEGVQATQEQRDLIKNREKEQMERDALRDRALWTSFVILTAGGVLGVLILVIALVTRWNR